MSNILNKAFLNDVLQGLSKPQKSLPSKYFYDQTGDALFRQIMQLPEYYPTRCEAEILQQQAGVIADLMAGREEGFDLIELGAGDAAKSGFLIDRFLKEERSFTYLPVDISASVIQDLNGRLPAQFPGLKVQGLQGDYFEMLEALGRLSRRPKLVLFLGGNIGNYFPEEATAFIKQLHAVLRPGDLLLTGFDLKKHPQTILAAYNDTAGITRDFNFNLLHRINRELHADFDVDQFEHYPTYDPETGACKSFLISMRHQEVHVGAAAFSFAENEAVFTEISQKYEPSEISDMAARCGFKERLSLKDGKGWFVDAVWEK